MDDLDVSNEYLSVNAPLSDVDFNAEMAALESTPYDDSGDTPPVHLDLPEVTVTNKPTELVGGTGTDTPMGTERSLTSEVANAVPIGVMNAGTEIAHTIANITDFLIPDAMNDTLGVDAKQAQRGADRIFPRLQEKDFNAIGLSQPESTVGKATSTIAQFMTGFAPALKAVRGIKMLNGTGRAAQTVKTAVGTGTAGAVADLSVFNPYEERLSNMAVDSGIPGMDNAITQYLKADADDPELLGRVKQTAEGYVVGKVLEPFIALVKATKRSKMVYAEEHGISESTDLTTKAYMTDPATGKKVIASESPRFTLEDPIIQIADDASQKELATLYLDGNLEGAAKQASGAINLKHVNTEEGIRDLIEGFAVMRDTAVGKHKRGWTEAAKKAGKLGTEGVVEGVARTKDLDSFVINSREARAAVAYKVKDLATAMKANPTPVNRAEFEDAFRKLVAIDAFATQTDAEIARAMKAMQKPITGGNFADDILSKTGHESNMDKLAEMVSNLDDSEAIARMAKASTLPNWQDAASEVYINGLFSPPTAFVNAMSNTLSMGGLTAERYLGATRSVTTGSGEISFREANQYAIGMAKGISEGFAAFAKSWKTNAPVMGTTVKFNESGHLKGFQGASFGIDDASAPLMQKLGKGLDLAGVAMRSMPGGTRSLMASDEFYKAMFYRGEVNALAQREAHKLGLKAGTPEHAAKIKEVLDGVNSGVVGSPYHGISMKAEEAAFRNTFTEELSDSGTKILQGVRSSKLLGLPSYAVLPFVKTPVNLMKYMGRRTPGLAGQSEYMLGELAAGGARRDLAEAQIGFGSMVLTTGMMLSAGGYLRGAMTENYNSRRNLTQLGAEQQAVILEDGTQIELGRLDGNPISFLLFAATTRETIDAYLEANVDELTDEELDEGVMEIMSIPLQVGAKLSLNKTWTAGVSQALEAVQNESEGNYLERLSGNLVPLGGTAKWIKTQAEIDPYLREASSAMDEMRNKIPGLSRTLPPVPDLLGNPSRSKQLALGINPARVSVPNDHPVMVELRRLQLETPNKTILGGVTRTLKVGDSTIKLDGVEKWNLMQFARQLKDADGKDMIDIMNEIIASPDYQKMTSKQRNNTLANVYNKRREFARKALQYDSKMFAEGLPRPYAEEYDLYDYQRKSPLADTVATKEYSKAKSLYGDVGMTREDFIETRNAALVESNLGAQLK